MPDGAAGAGPHADKLASVLEDTVAALESDATLGSPDRSFLESSFFDFTWPDEWEFRTGYWVNEPFAHVAVFRDPASRELRYHLTEPSLDDFESHVRQDAADRVRTRLLDAGIEREQGEDSNADDSNAETLDAFVVDELHHVAPGVRQKVAYYLRRDFLGYGIVDPFMQDPDIEDLHVGGSDRPAHIYHRDYGNIGTNRTWADGHLDSLAVRMAQRAGRHLSAAKPLLTTTLPDGSRVQVTLGTDIASHGSNLTIRKFREEPFTPPELVDYGTFSIAQMAYLSLAIEHNCSVMFVGPTASGKTTSMNACSLFVPPDAKIVSIEETREVNLPHANWISNVTRESDVASERPGVDTYELLSEALHQRPTHVIVGEIRTNPDVVFTFFQAVGTGHAGFTTFHADSARDTLRRLRNDPLSIPDELVSDIDVIVLQRMMEIDGKQARKARSITEVHDPPEPERTRPELNEVFAYDAESRSFGQPAASKLLGEVADRQGWSDERLRTELRRRQEVLAHMVDHGITDYEPVSDLLFLFGRDPERALERTDGVPSGVDRIVVTEDD